MKGFAFNSRHRSKSEAQRKAKVLRRDYYNVRVVKHSSRVLGGIWWEVWYTPRRAKR